MSAFAPMKPHLEMDTGVAFIVKKLKAAMNAHGATGILGLGRRFRIMDDDNSKSLSLSEFKKALGELSVNLTTTEIRTLFTHFDTDLSNTINYEEFIYGIRAPLTARRAKLVDLAFSVLDVDGSGEVDIEEVVGLYNADEDPDVISGKCTTKDVMMEFINTFEVGGVKDGTVTKAEFVNYYTNLGASIDNEDYFELMIRNAWHISGGKGQSANSTCLRVLVMLRSGEEAVVEVENDIGLDKDDHSEIMRRLRKQGVDVLSIPTAPKQRQEEGIPNHRGKKKVAGQSTFTSTISFSGVGTAKGTNDIGKPLAFKKKKGYVNDVHVDIHTSELAATLNPGIVKRMGAIKISDSGGGGKSLSEFMASTAQSSSSPTASPSKPNVDKTIERLRAQLSSRGAKGIIGMSRKFRIIDDDNSKSLQTSEFKKAMNECALTLSDAELTSLFAYFDEDNSGSIDFDEFLIGVRGPMSIARLRFVKAAFDILDKDSNGFVEPSDIVQMYNADKHPDVMSGKRTSEDVLREFLDTFDVGGEKDGKVTRSEFTNYYKNVSSSIDSDEYFELMMRNAWRISGGVGQAANSANRRVLVTDKRGKESVVTVEDDLGLDANDVSEVRRRLDKQGVEGVKSVDTKGGGIEEVKASYGRRGNNPNFQRTSLW